MASIPHSGSYERDDPSHPAIAARRAKIEEERFNQAVADAIGKPLDETLGSETFIEFFGSDD